MSIVTTKIHFDSIFETTYEPSGHGSYGSGYCKEQNKVNRKVKTIYLFGKKVFSKVLEKEIIPHHVWISAGCFGEDLSGWRSKWCNEPNFGIC